MRLPFYFLAIGGGTLVQSTVVPVFSVAGVVPDLPVILVVLLALRRGPEVGCVTGFALGLAQDAVAGGPLGLHALSKAIVGFVAGDLPRWCLVSNPLVPIMAAVFATVLDGGLRFAVLQLFHYPAAFTELFGRVILPQAAYNGLLAAVVGVLPVLRPRQ
ncbi:MAG TPA: rod shape-determining protein MreD [Methylomirabilota bacterium]|nr:rod shape-determining protein MreD [Methylomirabilota bacterium]